MGPILSSEYEIPACAVTKDESLRLRRRLLRVELLLKNRRPVEAEDAARGLMAEKLSPAQLIELATIFGHAQQFKNANLFYEQYRGTNLTGSEQAQAVNSKAAWLKKGEERWRLLLTADHEGSDGQRQAVAIVILEADQPEDAEIIGKLADGAKTTAVRTQLLLHQIELTKDKQQAADIALKLYAQKQISRNRLTWLIQLLSSAGRSREVVDILEKRLRSGERLDSELLNRLSSSYGLLGRETDRTRATTQKNQRMAPDNLPANRRMLGAGGGVF